MFTGVIDEKRHDRLLKTTIVRLKPDFCLPFMSNYCISHCVALKRTLRLFYQLNLWKVHRPQSVRCTMLRNMVEYYFSRDRDSALFPTRSPISYKRNRSLVLHPYNCTTPYLIIRLNLNPWLEYKFKKQERLWTSHNRIKLAMMNLNSFIVSNKWRVPSL